MRKLTVRFIIALLTFLLGTTATTVWLINRSAVPKVRVTVPNDRWVTIFFESPGLASKPINQITQEAGLPNLRTTLLPDNDLEVRAWSGFGADGKVYGIILRRSADQWFITHLYSPGRDQAIQKKEDIQAQPKSGWDQAWGRLVSAGVLTLPDAAEIKCDPLVVDGIGYIVEINTNQTYRTYHYGNPQLAKCDEAKQMVKVAEIIDEEFGWKD